MRSSNLSPKRGKIYRQLQAQFRSAMEDAGLSRRQRFEFLSMMCADEAKVETPECLDFIESVNQDFIEDMREDPPG
jgi:hypothetical protein